MDEAAAPEARRSRHAVSLAAVLAFLVGLIILLWYARFPSYDIWKAVHVAFAAIWLGGGVVIAILAGVAERARDRQLLMIVGRQAELVTAWIFTPASVVVLGFGVVTVEKGGWSWGEFWIVFAIVGWSISAATGILFLSPRVKKLNQLVALHGTEHPETERRLRTILTVTRVNAALLLLLVVDMTAKPFL